MSYHRAHILVTGGAGFIGSHVVDKLLAAGRRPRIYDRVPSRYVTPDRAPTVVGDLRDQGAVRGAMRGCDTVVHLAAMANADEVARQPTEAEHVNAEGTMNVLEAARDAGVKRVIYASTIWAYSDVEEPVVDEDTPLALPSHLYTATKVAGEMYCRSYAELYGLDFTILRFGIPYGPRARAAAVVPIFVGKALAGEPLTLAGDGSQSRRFVYVEDLADGVVNALAPCAANRIYNLVGDRDVTIKEVADAVAQQVGGTKIEYVPGRTADFKGVEVSAKRAEEELGWRAGTAFADGVARYVDWHRAEYEDPQEPAAPRAAEAQGPWRVLAGLPLRVAAGVGLVAMAVMFLAGLDRDGFYAADMRTLAITSLVGLALFLALPLDPEAEHGGSGVGRVGWLLTGALLAVALVGPYNPHHLVGSDLELLGLSFIGAGLGVGTGAVGRRARRERLRERASGTTS